MKSRARRKYDRYVRNCTKGFGNHNRDGQFSGTGILAVILEFLMFIF